MTPKEHILKIRQEYTGENSTINSDGEAVIQKLTKALTKTLSELAKNIYKKDSHFVMELIQNADDNNYKKVVKPSLKLIIQENQLIVQNNEIGFSEKNVSAICSVSESTKKLEDASKGYIGEKGIGFKSVFRISDAPEIYSNGYQFRFRGNQKSSAKNTQLEYILPEWIDAVNPFVDPAFTNIVLPLRPSISEKEKNKIKDVRPDLLLFLNKLRRLEIENLSGQETILLEKSKMNAFIQLKQTQKRDGQIYSMIQRYFTYQRTDIKVPARINVEQRKGVKRTKIVLGFPIDLKGNLNSDEEQSVYAYLPIGKYKFKFLIQADFILTSGREEIDEDNVWNHWIRDEVFETFTKAIEAFKKHKTFRHSFLRFIPSSGAEFSDFFLPLANKLLDYCRTHPVVLSESGKWHLPSEVLFCDSEVRKIVSNKLLLQSIGKDFVHLDSSYPEDLIVALEIAAAGINEVIKCLAHTETICKYPYDWFIDVFAFFSEHIEDSTTLVRIRKLKIIPINGEKKRILDLFSVEDGPIFLSLASQATYSFEKNLKILADGLLKRISKTKSRILKNKVSNFFVAMDIKKPTPHAIIQNYILKRYNSDEWQKSSADLVDQIRYIKDYWSDLKKHQAEIIKWFEDKPIIRCARKDIYKDNQDFFSKPSDVYISQLYGNSNHLEAIFADIPGINFIHDCYLKSPHKTTGKDGVRKDWLSFFRVFGCREIPTFDTSGNCPHIIKMLSLSSPSKNRILIKLIDKQWGVFKQQLEYKGRKSDWFRRLSEERVIPYGNELSSASEFFVRSNNVESFFGSDVKFYPDKLNSPFGEKIGLNTDITAKSVVNFLAFMSQKHFKIGQERAKRIYGHLLTISPDRIDKSRFKTQSLIYLHNRQAWYKPDQLFWNDYSSILGKDFGYCEQSYEVYFKKLFTEVIGVAERPGSDALVAFLKKLSGKTNFDQEEVKAIHTVFAELGIYAIDKAITDATLKQLQQCIWTNKSQFWSTGDCVFYNDNEILYNLFKNKSEIAFFDIPDVLLPKTKPLFPFLNIEPISKAVNARYINTEFASEVTGLTRRVRKYAESIESLIYTDYIEYHQQLKNTSLFDDLVHFTVFETPELKLEYTLNDMTETADASSYRLRQNIYLNRNVQDQPSLVALEIANYLGAPKIFEFIYILLSGKKTTITNILKVKNLVVPPEEKETPNSDNDGEVHSQFGDNEDDNIDNTENDYDNCDDDSATTDNPSNQPNAASPLKRWVPKVPAEETDVEFEQFSGSEYEYDSSDLGKSYPKTGFSNNSTIYGANLSQADRDAIGVFGEKKVYLELIKNMKRKYRDSQIEPVTNMKFQISRNGKVLVEIQWLNNRNRNQGGHDIIVVENGKTSFYEVKTTIGEESYSFNISQQQWMFLKAKGDDYSIVRVLNAGSTKPRILEIKNPFELWQEGRLKAFPICIELK